MSALALRETLVAYERDSYLNRVPSPADGAPPGLPPIDCVLGCAQWGVSPLAAAALRGFDPSALAPYPERHHETRLAPAVLARFAAHGVDASRLFFGHGSFNILERVVHKLVRPGCMIGVGPQFPELPSESQAAGGCYLPLTLEPPDYALPLERLETAVRRTRSPLVYVDNPNNPLGRHFPPAELSALAAACSRHGAVLLIDEALGDFLDDGDSCARLTTRYDNVIVTRSLSKAFGLAAERVGYAFFSGPLAAAYRRVDVPFEPGVLAATLARESLRDTAFLDRVRREAACAKAETVRALREAGLEVLPTHPAVSILTAHAGEDRNAARLLLSRGVLVQPGSCWARTHAGWNDGYCRLRVPATAQLAAFCERIGSLR